MSWSLVALWILNSAFAVFNVWMAGKNLAMARLNFKNAEQNCANTKRHIELVEKFK